MHKPALSTVFIGATAMVVVSLAPFSPLGLQNTGRSTSRPEKWPRKFEQRYKWKPRA